jgi:hypothetical protein
VTPRCASCSAAGPAATLVANRLRRRYRVDEAEITVVDQNDRHVRAAEVTATDEALTRADDR